MKHDCMEAGGRATHGAVAKGARTVEQLSIAQFRLKYMQEILIPDPDHSFRICGLYYLTGSGLPEITSLMNGKPLS